MIKRNPGLLFNYYLLVYKIEKLYIYGAKERWFQDNTILRDKTKRTEPSIDSERIGRTGRSDYEQEERFFRCDCLPNRSELVVRFELRLVTIKIESNK